MKHGHVQGEMAWYIFPSHGSYGDGRLDIYFSTCLIHSLKEIFEGIKNWFIACHTGKKHNNTMPEGENKLEIDSSAE